MKKYIVPFLALLALVLFFCGVGAQNPSQKDITKIGETTAKFVSEDTISIAEEIFSKWFPDIKNGYSDDPFSYAGSYDAGCEGCYANLGIHCYPLKEGGYLVAFDNVYAGPGCAGSYNFATWTYKDGLEDTISGILPLPELEQLLDPSKTGPYKAEIANFKEMYDKGPLYYLYFIFNPPYSLSVELYPYDCEDTYPGMEETRWNSYYGDPTPTYFWNGEKFVKE
jgi:hypothetical protein